MPPAADPAAPPAPFVAVDEGRGFVPEDAALDAPVAEVATEERLGRLIEDDPYSATISQDVIRVKSRREKAAMPTTRYTEKRFTCRLIPRADVLEVVPA